ncbi:MAG: serine protein kinase [Candidatus Thorarchaeota archaeon]|jgi:serine protein kinase
MAANQKEFLKLIKGQRDKSRKEKWSGSFLDYLDKVKENPSIIKLSHKRVYEAITNAGVGTLTDSDERFRKLFDEDRLNTYDYFQEEFFGMERVVNKVMKFLRAASHKGEESRQILLLMGPVGAGKSAITEHIKKALEQGEPYYYLEGCPIREEPLHLVPRSLRSEFSEMLGVHIEGDLCPICRMRLMEEYNGEYERFPVKVGTFSVRGRRGVGVVPPTDPNTQDISILIGSEDISKLDKYPEDDPRVLSLNGAFNVGNRGIVEFVEIFKNEVEFLHPAITVTQEKHSPAPGKHPMIYHDVFIISHCNEAEWNKFKSDHLNEAIMDRIVKIDVPYVLELEQEMKIYEKQLGRSDFDAHVAPHTLEIASMFSIMSRLSNSAKVDALTKLRLYNGDEVIEKGHVRKIDIKDLREEAVNEGMSGISTRFIMKAIDDALTTSERNMITPISVMDALIRKVKEQIANEDTKAKCLELLQKTIREEYLKILEKEIAKAFITAFEDNAESLFNLYLDNAEAYTNNMMLKDSITKEERPPDGKFMEALEQQIGITGSAKDGFRQDVTSYMFRKVRTGGKIDYTSYAPLKEAIESYMMSSVRDMARIVTKSRTRDDEQKKKYSEMVQTLIDEYGYSEKSAEEILTYAANNLWRDS